MIGKSFRKQFKECEKNGIAIIDYWNGWLRCKKYGGQCQSSNCKQERLGDINDAEKGE